MKHVRTPSGQRIVSLATVVLSFAFLATVPHVRAYSGDLLGSTDGCYTPSGTVKATIALDPGHGGGDSGAVNSTYGGPELHEADVVLDIAGQTKDVLVGHGYQVCLTRTTRSANPSNTDRAMYANSKNAARLVLIHLNGSSDHNVDYTQTFWGKKTKDLEFSNTMYNALYPALGVKGNGVGQFASGALLKSNMPATLTENVFLTNDGEARKLAVEGATTFDGTSYVNTRRQQIAQAIATGIRTSLGDTLP